MTDEESKRVVFSVAKTKLALKAKGAESGRSKVEMPIEFDHKPIEISFDPKFVNDMLKVLEPDAPVAASRAVLMFAMPVMACGPAGVHRTACDSCPA